MDITSSACLSEVQSLLDSRPKITLVRSFQATEAQRFIDFLDQVSQPRSLNHRATVDSIQVLLRSGLGNRHWRRSLRLIRKISKARSIMPSSCVVQDEHIHARAVHYSTGLREVSEGEYQGTPVAIKRVNVNEKDPDKIFKVPSIDLENHPD